MTMNDAHEHGFVEDGYERARAAIEPKVRAQVSAEYGERLKNASSSEQARLRKEMAQEIERRIDAQSPPDAIY